MFFTESASLLFTLGFVGALVAAIAALASGAPPWQVGGAAIAVAAAVLFSVTTWSVSVPGSYFSVALFLPVGWFLLGLFWIGWVIYVALRHRRAVSVRHAARLLLAPLLTVLAIVVVETDAAFDLRYAASKGAMNAIARDIVAGSRSPQEVDRIGLWEVEKVQRVRGGMRFLVVGTGFLDPVGFAYSPRGEPPTIGEDSYEHFEGPWWIWVESW